MRRTGVVLALAVGVFALGGCSASDESKTEDLRESLRQAHEYDSGYDGLGEVTFSDGNVTVDADEWADPLSGAQLYCEWVSSWLYDDGNGSADSRVTVRMGGEQVLTRRGESEDCVEAALRSGFLGG